MPDRPRPPRPSHLSAPGSPLTAPGQGPERDQDVRFLSLVTERHGPLASIPLDRAAGISAALAPQVDLNTGAARTALRKAALAAQNGNPR